MDTIKIKTSSRATLPSPNSVNSNQINKLISIDQLATIARVLIAITIAFSLFGCSEPPTGKSYSIHHQPPEQVLLALEATLKGDYKVVLVGDKIYITPEPEDPELISELVAQLDTPPVNYSVSIRPQVKGISTRGSRNQIEQYILQEKQPLLIESGASIYLKTLFGYEEIQSKNNSLNLTITPQSNPGIVTVKWTSYQNSNPERKSSSFSLANESRELTLSIPLNYWTPLTKQINPPGIKTYSTKRKPLAYEIYISAIGQQ